MQYNTRMKIQLISGPYLEIWQRDIVHPAQQFASYFGAKEAIITDQANGEMPKRPLAKGDFVLRWQYSMQPEETITHLATTSSSRQVEL